MPPGDSLPAGRVWARNPSAAGGPLRHDLALNLSDGQLAATELRVKRVLEAVLCSRPTRPCVQLGPEILRAVGSTQLERDQVVDLVLARAMTDDSIFAIDPILQRLGDVAHAGRVTGPADLAALHARNRCSRCAARIGLPTPWTAALHQLVRGRRTRGPAAGCAGVGSAWLEARARQPLAVHAVAISVACVRCSLSRRLVGEIGAHGSVGMRRGEGAQAGRQRYAQGKADAYDSQKSNTVRFASGPPSCSRQGLDGLGDQPTQVDVFGAAHWYVLDRIRSATGRVPEVLDSRAATLPHILRRRAGVPIRTPLLGGFSTGRPGYPASTLMAGPCATPTPKR